MMIAATTVHRGWCRSGPAPRPPTMAPIPKVAQNVPRRAAEPCISCAMWIGRATSTGPYRKKKAQVTVSRPVSRRLLRMALLPLVAMLAGGGIACIGTGDGWAGDGGTGDVGAERQVTASTAKLAASAAITQPGPAQAVRPPARAGPTM